MRAFLTPDEIRLRNGLPAGERAVLDAFFTETDARLVTEGEEGRFMHAEKRPTERDYDAAASAPGAHSPLSPSVTEPLFDMKPKRRPNRD